MALGRLDAIFTNTAAPAAATMAATSFVQDLPGQPLDHGPVEGLGCTRASYTDAFNELLALPRKVR